MANNPVGQDSKTQNSLANNQEVKIHHRPLEDKEVVKRSPPSQIMEAKGVREEVKILPLYQIAAIEEIKGRRHHPIMEVKGVKEEIRTRPPHRTMEASNVQTTVDRVPRSTMELQPTKGQIKAKMHHLRTDNKVVPAQLNPQANKMEVCSKMVDPMDRTIKCHQLETRTKMTQTADLKLSHLLHLYQVRDNNKRHLPTILLSRSLAVSLLHPYLDLSSTSMMATFSILQATL